MASLFSGTECSRDLPGGTARSRVEAALEVADAEIARGIAALDAGDPVDPEATR